MINLLLRRSVATTLAAAFLLLALPATAQQTLTPEGLWQLRRISAPAVSPDGRTAAFTVTTYDVAANGSNIDLYTIPVAGGEPRQITTLPGKEYDPQWRPDGGAIGFLATESGDPQLWEVAPDGGTPRQVSRVEGGIANFLYAPDGKHVSYTSDVKLDSTVQDLYADLPLADARIIDDLMYRHWDQWHDFKYSHLFIAPYAESGLGEGVDAMPGERFDTPRGPFGGVEGIAWHPDGRSIVYVSKKLNGAVAARSTNSDLYRYDLATRKTTNLTAGMPGYDEEPAFSPNGKTLAWLSMAREGYEADRNRLFVLDLATGQKRELSQGFDANAHAPEWTPDGSAVVFTSETQGTVQLYAAHAETGEMRRITEGMHDYLGFDLAGTGTALQIIAARQSMSAPTDLYRIDMQTGQAAALTQINADLLAPIKMGRVEKRMIEATDGKEILTWVIYPPDFDPSKKYPALLYAQGGPQSQVSQFFSYRWNFQLMAGNGYIIIAPNRRGLPGFGQAWNEEISGDWGGQAMRDLLSATDAVAAEPYVDNDRLGAIGASFGGYSMYWLAGHHEGRFKTFVAHAGVFNLESMYGSTEELFFVDFDLGGPYWESPTPASYAQFSPHHFVGNWDTPMLIIHGEKDFRVPVAQGMQAFTALQVKGIPSRFLYFPEEGHWILKPQNGLLWHRVFFDWLDRFLMP